MTNTSDAATLRRLSVSLRKEREVNALAQSDGFEPSPQESKSCVLPLHQNRIFKPHIYQSPYGRRIKMKSLSAVEACEDYDTSTFRLTAERSASELTSHI